MFVGREEELTFLNARYQSKNAELIVLYGRRRVGKTETLREFCKGKPHVFFSCTQAIDKIQLRKFSTCMLDQDIPAKKYVSEFDDWEAAFTSIVDLPYGNQKKLVVIDEFPEMCKVNKSIPSILQNIWDSVLQRENVMIVLCGSSMSFIEKEVLSEKNPLFGRATGIYKMNEMGFYDAAKFFPEYSARDKVLTYAILGGMPHYLRQFSPEHSVGENIVQNIFSKGCILYSEVEFLLHQELRETSVYNSIIEAVALGNTKLNDISQKSLIDDTSKTSVYLKNLIELGIVTREFSVDVSLKQRSNSNRGVYKLTDNFFRFWYAFGFANFSQLEVGGAADIYEHAVKPNLNQFASLPFEDVCKEFLLVLLRKGKLPFRFVKIGRWTGKTTLRDENSLNSLRTAETEIDILCVDREARNFLVGECKFKNSPFSYDDYLNTVAKLSKLKESSEFHYAFFSANGFEDRVIDEAKASSAQLFNIDDIVSLPYS